MADEAKKTKGEEKQKDEAICAYANCLADEKCVFWLSVYLIIMALVLCVGFLTVWHHLQAAIHEHTKEPIFNNIVATIGGDKLFAVKSYPAPGTTETPGETILLISDAFGVLVVILAGAFGGFIHSARSFYYHVQKGDLMKSGAVKYVIRPFSGAALALIFYMVLRAGLSQSTIESDSSGSIIFYAAVAALVGLFTDQTVAKLKKIAEAILTSPEDPKDEKTGEEQKSPA